MGVLTKMASGVSGFVASIEAGFSGFGFGRSAFEGASRTSEELRDFRPRNMSLDAALLPERDLLVDRQKDLIHNNAISSGYARSRLDDVIGTGLRLLPRPDYLALGQTAEWAELWQRQVKSMWSQYAEDIDKWCDYTRNCNIAQMQKLLYFSYIFNQEMIVVAEWRSRKRQASSRTAFNVINPELLCNPNDIADTDTLRRGVQFDAETGEAVGYWFRQKHPSESLSYTSSAAPGAWKYVPRYVTSNGRMWGRQQVFHTFELEEPGQSRGKPTFAAAVLGLKCLEKFERTSLQAQIVQAMYAAVIESTAPAKEMFQALGGRPSENGIGPLAQYVGASADYYDGAGQVRVGGASTLQLFPNEKLEFKTPGNVAPTLDMFHHKSLLNLSRALPGVSYERLSGDYSKTNYSSARAADLGPWKFIVGERKNIAEPILHGMYSCLLEEWMDDGRVPTPAGAPSYYEAKTAWTRGRWLGAPRGHIDEVKAQTANKLRREMGTLTHEDHCAEEGLDADEVRATLKQEQRGFEADGLALLLPNAALAVQQTGLQAQAEASAANNSARPVAA